MELKSEFKFQTIGEKTDVLSLTDEESYDHYIYHHHHHINHVT